MPDEEEPFFPKIYPVMRQFFTGHLMPYRMRTRLMEEAPDTEELMKGTSLLSFGLIDPDTGALVGIPLGFNASPFNIATAGAVSWVEASNLTGADGTSITTLAQISGTASSYSGAATLRTGSNGINGRNALQFNGSSNKLATANGGAELRGDFYVAAVVKFNDASGFQNIFSWGDASDHERRSLFKGDYYGNYSLDFIVQGTGYDVLSPGQEVLTTGTTYLLEVLSLDGQITLAINGKLQISASPTLSDYTSEPMIIGANLANGEFFNGLLSALFVHAAPTIALQQNVRNYLCARYLPELTQALALPQRLGGDGAIVQNEAGDLMWAGGFGPLNTGGTGQTFSTLANFSINGNLAAHGGGREHMLTNAWANQNTLLIWNRDPGGFSAIRFGFQGDGKEVGAIGFAPPGFAPWGAATYGSFYIEVSNFHDTSKYGIFRIVQTKVDLGPGTDGAFVRVEMEEAGDIVFYQQDGSTEVLRLHSGGGISMKHLPTSSSGLASGRLWLNSNVITVVP